MRTILVLATVVVLTGCSGSKVVKPKESLSFQVSKATLEGEAPCNINLLADGELVVKIDASESGVKCKLPFRIVEEEVD